ncbi:hypothetical protein [Silvanigrella aquatica]|uniref:Uncharacterized protein n=1 Tax=Silvanigrella aquatica TaxID=1915309 RepID=A0A1L4D079_9BACT|nr:hypothetical protein [Silvanigrella aquatica]APJ03590.1 hypothetical protein AXG55_06585 [Silvanigrella aquatica]
MKHKDQFINKSIKYSILAILLIINKFTYAQSSSNFQRQNDRNSERWSLTTYFTEKNKLKQSDLLIRFYSDGSGKNTPRLEPFIYGVWYNANGSDGTVWEGMGYGGSLYFNNFISGILKIPTPNIVLGAFGEHREEASRNLNHIDTFGGSLRFFGRNQQDSALFINFRNSQRPLQGQYYEEWNWEAAVIVYLAQRLRFEGSWLFSNNDWPAIPSNYAQQSGFKVGGGIEIGIFRFSGFFEKNSFIITNPNYTANPMALKSFDETRRVLQVGFSI